MIYARLFQISKNLTFGRIAVAEIIRIYHANAVLPVAPHRNVKRYRWERHEQRVCRKTEKLI